MDRPTLWWSQKKAPDMIGGLKQPDWREVQRGDCSSIFICYHSYEVCLAYTLNISDVLRHLDQRDFDYYSKLTEEQKKAFPGPVALRFLSSTGEKAIAPLVLMQVNEIANVGFYEIHQHPELQWKLLASCGCGTTINHRWISNIKSSTARNPLTDFLQSLHPGANDFELDLLYASASRADIVGLTQDCALTPDRAKQVINAFDKKTNHG